MGRKALLNNNQKIEAKAIYESGKMTYKQIAEKYKVSENTMYTIIKGRTKSMINKTFNDSKSDPSNELLCEEINQKYGVRRLEIINGKNYEIFGCDF